MLIAAAAAPAHGVGPYQIGVTQLVSPRLGLIAFEPSLVSGHASGARLQGTTSAGSRMTAIGPKLPPESLIDDVFFLDREHGWLSVWSLTRLDVRVYRTVDGGRHWRGVHVTGHVMAAGSVATIQFLTPRVGWLVNQQPTAPNASLYVTGDGGAHWRLVDDDLPEVAPVALTSTRVAWQAGGFFGGKLERSRDGGRTWTKTTFPVPAAERAARAIPGVPASFGAEILVPVTYLRPDGAVLAVYRSVDEGDRWTLTSLHDLGAGSAPVGCLVSSRSPAPLAVSLVTPSTWWVGFNRGHSWFVDRTADGGTRWQRNRVAAVSSVYCAPLPDLQAVDGRTAWFAFMSGRQRALYTTSTGGRRWLRLEPKDPPH